MTGSRSRKMKSIILARAWMKMAVDPEDNYKVFKPMYDGSRLSETIHLLNM